MRKPHIVRLSDGWWCAGYDGQTPYIAYARWFMATGWAYLSSAWGETAQSRIAIGAEE